MFFFKKMFTLVNFDLIVFLNFFVFFKVLFQFYIGFSLHSLFFHNHQHDAFKTMGLCIKT